MAIVNIKEVNSRKAYQATAIAERDTRRLFLRVIKTVGRMI
jgi:hypothetical protein